MAIQEFVQITLRAIRYDGTNSAEIISEMSNDPTVSEVAGVWEVNDPNTFGATTVNVGDYHQINGWFIPAADFKQHYRTLSLGIPE